MVEIKDFITFDEVKAIAKFVKDNVFKNGTYHPECQDFASRTGLILAFAPDFDLSDCEDNNDLYGRIYSDEAEQIVDMISGAKQFEALTDMISNVVEYNLTLLINDTPMSVSDCALAKLLDTVEQKISEIDTSIFDVSTINTLTGVVGEFNKDDFMDKMVDVMLKKGVLKK